MQVDLNLVSLQQHPVARLRPIQAPLLLQRQPRRPILLLPLLQSPPSKQPPPAVQQPQQIQLVPTTTASLFSGKGYFEDIYFWQPSGDASSPADDMVQRQHLQCDVYRYPKWLATHLMTPNALELIYHVP